MSAVEVVKEGLAAGDFGKLDRLVAHDFAMSGPVLMPVGKREFVGLMMAMLKAMPDWKFNATDFKENGDQATSDCRSRAPTGELQLPMPAMQAIPATGTYVVHTPSAGNLGISSGRLTGSRPLDIYQRNK